MALHNGKRTVYTRTKKLLCVKISCTYYGDRPSQFVFFTPNEFDWKQNLDQKNSVSQIQKYTNIFVSQNKTHAKASIPISPPSSTTPTIYSIANTWALHTPKQKVTLLQNIPAKYNLDLPSFLPIAVFITSLEMSRQCWLSFPLDS